MMLKREFTKREKVLILVLAILLLLTGYYKFVNQPTADRIATAQNACYDIESETTIESAKAQRLSAMRDAIEKYESATGGISSVVPAYDNIDNVMIQLDSILGAASDYSLTFRDVVFGDDAVTRPVDMTFTCGSYDTARDIIEKLDGCMYRCALNDITVAVDGKSGVDITNGGVAVSLTATFYETYQ